MAVLNPNMIFASFSLLVHREHSGSCMRGYPLPKRKVCQLGALFIDLHDVYARIFMQLAYNGHVICLFWTALQKGYSSSTQTFQHTAGESVHRWIGNKQQIKVGRLEKRARQAELAQSINNMFLKWVVSERSDDKWMEMLCTQLRLIPGWRHIVKLEILERNIWPTWPFF